MNWTRASAVAIVVVVAITGPLCVPSMAEVDTTGDCKFFFCEPEPWLSYQNVIHVTAGYSLQLTASGMNDSPWKDFLWLSVIGTGIEVFQGACLEHPLYGGFSYKNIVANEIGLLAGIVAYRLLFDRSGGDAVAGRRSQVESPSPASTLSLPPMARYARPCNCYDAPQPLGSPATVLSSPHAEVAGLLKPGLHFRYTGGSGRGESHGGQR